MYSVLGIVIVLYLLSDTVHAYVSKTVETIQLKSKISTLESHSSLLTHQLKLEVIYNHNLSLF